jgi:hypothetical protein
MLGWKTPLALATATPASYTGTARKVDASINAIVAVVENGFRKEISG